MLKRQKKITRPAGSERKGLQLVMGGIFLCAARLMVAGGLATLMLFIAAVMFGCGMWRWRRVDTKCLMGIIPAVILLLGGVTETWGYTARVSQAVSLSVHGAATVIGTAAAIFLALITFRVSAQICRKEGAKDTAEILAQRQWWIVIGYAVCGGWVLVDLLTGWMPNIGVILRIASILLDIFYLSALFQVRKVLE